MNSALAGLLALVPALAPTIGDEPKPPASAPDTAVDAAPETPMPADLRGTWRFDLRVVSHATVAVLGTTEVKSRTIFLATVSGTRAQPTVHTAACHIHAEPSRALAQTLVPQGFVDALPQKTFPAELTWNGEQWSFHGDMRPQYIGYDPGISDDELPQHRDDPGITDLEGDGHPGATIHLDVPLFGLVEMYMVQRTHTILDGTWSGADIWEGTATVRGFSQRTIGASNRLFVANAEVALDNENSRFRWARVPMGTTCAKLREGVGAAPGGPF